MKTDRALKEVWGWKFKNYKERKNMTLHEIVQLIEKNADEVEKKYNLNLSVVTSPEEIKLTKAS